MDDENKTDPVEALRCEALFGVGVAVTKRVPNPYPHGCMKRDDNNGVIQSLKHSDAGLLLLVKHDGRKAPMWWSAHHWMRSPNANAQPTPEGGK